MKGLRWEESRRETGGRSPGGIRGGAFRVTLRIIWPNFLLDIWHIDAYLNPTFGPGVFDYLRCLFRRLGTGSDSRSFVVKDATRLAPKELIHRHANTARMIHLHSKGVQRQL